MASTNISTTCSSSNNLFDYVLHQYWNDSADPRTADLPLMSGGPWFIISMMLIYVLLCGYIGPAIMKNHQPFQLRNIMLVYNIIAVLLNAYFFIMFFYYLNFGQELFNFSFPSHINITSKQIWLSRLAYFYFLSKLYDLLDTGNVTIFVN